MYVITGSLKQYDFYFRFHCLINKFDFIHQSFILKRKYQTTQLNSNLKNRLKNGTKTALSTMFYHSVFQNVGRSTKTTAIQLLASDEIRYLHSAAISDMAKIDIKPGKIISKMY